MGEKKMFVIKIIKNSECGRKAEGPTPPDRRLALISLRPFHQNAPNKSLTAATSALPGGHVTPPGTAGA